MDIRHCFDVLELDSNASIDEAKQAYKDMVNIWHPDRFSNNPRLKQKAEDKLKEINEAYEMMQSFLSLKKPLEPEKAPHAKGNSGADISANASSRARYHKSHAETGTKDKTEAFFEAGTGIVLSLFSYISSAVRRIVTEAKTGIDQGKSNQWQKSDDMRGKGRGRGMRSGKRMGRGGRGGGRGKGKGM
ncbi:MAG TPA: DnaJ domain-containing protein [Desulfatiglandales bacterium]|nr:DnaJ domain-containing protein [Desulfatiglandales bacterium]